ncbi:hypothetical protein MTO96_033102 [Rhipicephalus appendiculatus]
MWPLLFLLRLLGGVGIEATQGSFGNTGSRSDVISLGSMAENWHGMPCANMRQLTRLQLNMSDLDGKVYTDPNTAAVLLVDRNKNLLVEGFFGNGIRIRHESNATLSAHGSVPHILTWNYEQLSADERKKTRGK